MRVLVACECSGVVREAFRNLGHDAWSCDLKPALDGSKYHIEGDAIAAIDSRNWDLMIAHPPCTYLTCAGNRWFKPEYKERFPEREQQREDGIKFFRALANASVPRIAVENPIGVMSRLYRKPDQIIQPWQFGHPVAKATCLWLKNLPTLTPTHVVEPDYITFKSGKRMSKWYADLVKLPPYERATQRSITFQGVAEAMAATWNVLDKDNQ